ncbi:MAG TPA: hypothetical protein HA282_00800 [Nanoarchaeota archaeon]|nr:MAG: hypothetical protein QT01_C0002G0021 [archaeon GW2011_AR6]HIH17249.1 hypothetical protein [Nanoarchaeota archaeon]HIH34295.1 hypothetical protein [Nanoarchaeota archaeon]HIH50847.1 hypothetical protein [Nanoarchaeota archaeon]HIH65741.1 hypothetical protein [Nanoarchaeota archaeon]
MIKSLHYRILDVGAYGRVMSQLRAAGLQPATIAQVARGRLDGDLSFYLGYNTSSGVSYAPGRSDKFKVLSYSQDLAEVTMETEICNGGIVLSPEQYEALQAPEFSTKEVAIGRKLTQDEAEVHAGWLALFDGDKGLQGEYIEKIFREVMNGYSEKEAMGFYIRTSQQVSNVSPAYFYDLLCVRSGVNGCGLINDSRLVGVEKYYKD